MIQLLKFHRIMLLMVVSAVLMGSCATPSSPTGGPRDQQAPRIVKTKPESGSTNITTQSIFIELSEYVNRETFRTALSIEPQPRSNYKLDWWFTDVTIRFEEPLRDETTFVITLGRELKDVSGNALKQPVRIALSTGDEIDQGRTAFRIRKFDDGSAVEDGYVFLLEPDADLSSAARYASESDTGGVFQFEYVKPGNYRPVYVRDLNRDRKWQSREIGRPLSDSLITVTADSISSIPLSYIQIKDNAGPILNGIGLLADDFMRFRFSEEVRWSRDQNPDFSASLNGQLIDGYLTHQTMSPPGVVLGYLEEETMFDSVYTITEMKVTDLAGNSVQFKDSLFYGSDQEDTIANRIVNVSPSDWLEPEDSIVVSFKDYIEDAEQIKDSLIVVEGKKVYEQWSNFEIDEFQFTIYPDSVWEKEVSYEFRIYEPYTYRFYKYSPRVISEEDLSSISIIYTSKDSTDFPLVGLIADERGEQTFTITQDTTTIDGLIGNQADIRVFKDKNGNEVWDGGSLFPYILPEPLFQQFGIPLRSSMTSEIEIKLN